jgi:hypothetical protein
MAEFMARSSQAQNPALWLVAQAVSATLPDGDKEEQSMQGLLNQQEQLAEAQGRLFWSLRKVAQPGNLTMTSTPAVLKGVVHGKSIELEQEPGFPDGQAVSVVVQPLEATQRLPPGEGIRRSAGSWGDDAEGLDEYLAWNRRQRKISRREIPE